MDHGSITITSAVAEMSLSNNTKKKKKKKNSSVTLHLVCNKCHYHSIHCFKFSSKVFPNYKDSTMV